jgi:superfamily II DNA helicase RecQ
VCAALEESGLLVLEEGRRYRARVSAAEIRTAIADAAPRFEILRLQDRRRLDAMDEYALVESCRAAFIRRWFGEPDPPPCGRCDRCRGAAWRRR